MSRYAKGAAMLCNNPLFRDYLTATTGRAVPDAATAAAEVRLACGVLSRRELDGNLDAGRAYLALVSDFNRWVGRQHATA
ncbi:MAG: hypothetical protein Tp170SUR00d2C46354221_25 [Prokaryotic dsDNA virus sp.]|nr:MAG: hypothetical protein Unbinned4contig1000_34 [Prokaryotic dsDNA virus sp.]QDP48118.1 MAG: hypothetical protein Tp170SUR00d2C46354221_25 [Prokaryotic dsDNA virus sp.]QDP53273.1 MAG: hypothetical protein Unbinned28contig1000_29 [Prokaryotic dsDNA virus sp.]